jgi:biotin-(acetyl-CoA carboxylase) ligase
MAHELCGLIGRKINVISQTGSFAALALRIDECGALIVTDEAGVQMRLLSGEVSIRRL